MKTADSRREHRAAAEPGMTGRWMTTIHGDVPYRSRVESNPMWSIVSISLVAAVLGFAVGCDKSDSEENALANSPKLQSLLGQTAPELQHVKAWKNGGPVSLAELHGKYVLLDFWGYWCGPCVAILPELFDLHDEFSKKGLVVIAVHDASVQSIEEMETKLRAVRTGLWRGRDIPFVVALDGGDEEVRPGAGKTTAAYGITLFPTTLLIDKKGRVVRRLHHPGGLSRERFQQLLEFGRGVDEVFPQDG